jgi:hypothetical protein
LAALVSVPQLVACAVTVRTAVLPTFRFSISHVADCPEPVPPSAPPVDETYASPVPSVSSTHTPAAAAGPLFVTRISHVAFEPQAMGWPDAGEVWLTVRERVGVRAAIENVPTDDRNDWPHGFS